MAARTSRIGGFHIIEIYLFVSAACGIGVGRYVGGYVNTRRKHNSLLYGEHNTFLHLNYLVWLYIKPYPLFYN